MRLSNKKILEEQMSQSKSGRQEPLSKYAVQVGTMNDEEIRFNMKILEEVA